MYITALEEWASYFESSAFAIYLDERLLTGKS
jgi:hypothetical protein